MNLGRVLVLKDIELKMLSELIKNCKRSDRELARAIGISQPTATRIRSKLEKEGYIRQYTTIPDLNKIGYTVASLNFVKLDLETSQPQTDVSALKELLTCF